MKKKLLAHFSTFCCAILFCSALSAQTQYCNTPVTASDGTTVVYLSLQTIATDQYEIKITSEAEMIGLGGSYARINGEESFQLNAEGNYALSDEGKTLTVSIASTTAPDPYTPLYVMMPGEKVFTWPSDIDWTASCNGSDTDTEIPTGFTATLGQVSYNSVELLANGTDDSGFIKYVVSYEGGSSVSAVGNSDTPKSILVTGLAPNTEYTFSITAKDLAGNEAENSSLTITTTTSVLPAPTTGAPTPKHQQDRVISIFSDIYTPHINSEFNPNWGQSTQVSSMEVEEGDNVLKYETLNYQGTDFGADIDVTSMTMLHVDVWTPDETLLQFYCINHNPQDEKFVELDPLKLNEWNSFDIPLSDYTTQGLDITSLFQFKVVGSGNYGGSKKIVFLDNIYFYDNAVTSIADATNKDIEVNCYLNAATNDLVVNAKSNINQLIIYSLTGQAVENITVNAFNKTVNLNRISAGSYLVKINLANGTQITKKIIK